MAADSAGAVPADEPVAIIGMACRFPGAENLDAFWRLLEAGASGVIEGVPGSGVGRIGELFPDADVQSEACRFGGYVDGIDQFDATFFRISPLEAQLLDPQQRMMLETSWQALEDAGIDAEALAGSRTGVYAGISNLDYRGLTLESSDTDEATTSLYSVSGTSLNTAIGRVAFALGLNGPAMAVDTACSSSLVAVHQAVAGLQRGEADLALAGGVNAILSGRLSELRGNAGMLAPDGQCKAFDASANGFVRGEGCGIVVLKLLSKAEADGDRIWGVILGSAVNQDGATPGLTVPSREAQERVVGEALARAGVQASDVDYVETHGTGTSVGDPIEAQAVGTAYSRGRDPANPLLIGSVKTNVGHLEAAAGIAGLIKATLAVKRGLIPRHLHFRNPNPAIDWDRLPLRVTTEPTPWPGASGRPRLAGVSAFGWSGTNAHALVRGHSAGDAHGTERSWASGPPRLVAAPLPEPAPEVAEERATRVLPLSGKSDEALGELAGRYLEWLEERSGEVGNADGADRMLVDMAWTAGVGRSHFGHRAGVTFRDAASLREGLAALSEAAAGPGPRTATRVAFAYTGGSSQWTGMGKALYEREPVARAVLDRCEAVFREERGASLLDVMFGRDEAGDRDLDDAEWMQPAIYALGCALTALWESVGVRPDVVLGHSLGEIAAAQTAGVYSLEDGMRFTARRSLLMAALPGEGAMAAVYAPARRVAAAVEEQNAASAGLDVNIAADNGAQQVISGPATGVQALVERFASEGLWARELRKSLAYHSALVEPALDDLEALFGDLDIAPPSIDLISSTTGRLVESTARPDGAYWRRHAREPVAFRECINTLAEMGVDVVVELGAQRALGTLFAMSWPGANEPASVTSQHGPAEAEETGDSGFAEAVAEAYEAGLAISFEGLYAGEERRRISLPSYPFQRQRYWVEPPRRRRLAAGHPLLGVRHESPRGEVLFEREMSEEDPAWLDDHRVFGRSVAPGALYGVMAVAAASPEENAPVAVEDLQLRSALVLPGEENGAAPTRRVQVVVDGPATDSSRRVEVYSKGDGEEEWTLHAEARVSSGGASGAAGRLDLEGLKAGLSEEDPAAFYRGRAEANIQFGRRFRTLQRLWRGDGEAVAEVALPAGVEETGAAALPILVDGLLQVMVAARTLSVVEAREAYLAFAWDSFWLTGPLPERVICHARMRESGGAEPEGAPRETLTGDLRLYTTDGVEIGGLEGYAAKHSTRAALLSGTESGQDLHYEVIWEDRPLAPGMVPADFLPSPSAVAATSMPFSDYLAAEEVAVEERESLLADMERMARSVALTTLERLGWTRTAGERVELETLRERLKVPEVHGRLFRRMFGLLAAAGVVEEAGDGFVVLVGADDPLPEDLPADPAAFADEIAPKHEHGATEIALFRRCGGALPEVLMGDADPLTLLFGSGEPSAGDLYRLAPAARAANRMLGDAVAAVMRHLPEDRNLRVIEVGAGTGSGTGVVLPELPVGRYDYMYTDISAGFFAEAEERFGGSEASIDYRMLDLEKDPVEQGFDAHAYDLVIASNVLHATQFLKETLAHCRDLLAPSGHLIALEGLRIQGWMDLTFGQLESWWRFADDFRPDHPLATPEIWRESLADAGFEEAEVLGLDSATPPDRGIIVARGPAEVLEPAGAWILTPAESGEAEKLAAELAAHHQTVVPGPEDVENRDAWRAVVEGLPGDLPLSGVVHLAALDGRGAESTTGELADDAERVTASALALVQGLADADAMPARGVWFLTRGGQVLERERGGELTGALLWGFGKVVEHEAPFLKPRMIDLEPGTETPPADLINELLHPDDETQVAYRLGRRQTARLVRVADVPGRLPLPDGSSWTVRPGAGGAVGELGIDPLPERALEPRDVRVAIDAVGLNFLDILVALGVFEDELGAEFCGRVIEIGEDVTAFAVGERVVGLTLSGFGTEAVTREEMVAPAPEGLPVAALATIPAAFVSALLSFEAVQLKAGDRVLIHAASGGVGQAAVQLAQAAGAEVFATASAPKQASVRALGVEHVFDSRQTAFGHEILDATGGEGVDVVLNSLTGPGFIDASLSCLKVGGRFAEMAVLDILTEEEMASRRPDVSYFTLRLDLLKEHQPEVPGRALRGVMERVAAGELGPLSHVRWPLAEAETAIRYMQAARHVGRIVLTNSALESGRLRGDRTYLVTGGLGGIGCAVAGWLADRGAGVIVLNGRRDPDDEAREAIAALRARGVRLEVELADVTDSEAVDAMLARIDESLPPLAGVIHSVGVLSDAALTNQSWERFEEVLWPKVLGAWQLHRATIDRDLGFFVLFSSVAGVIGNPGQANHSAANAFLDQLAGHRRALGLPGQAIAWGAWEGIGEAEEQRGRIGRQLETAGAGWMNTQQGLQALERLMRQDATTGLVASLDWQAFSENVEQRSPLLDNLLATGEGEGDDGDSQAELLAGLRYASPDDREQRLVAFLQQEMRAVMRMPTTPAPSVDFSDLGMDSLMAVELRNRLNRAFAGEYVISNTAVFDYPSITSLAGHLAGELGDGGETPAERGQGAQEVRPAARSGSEGIAIVGMACRFPGAEDIDAFWELLASGGSAVTDGRQDSGPWEGIAGDPGAESVRDRRGAYVERIDEFDASFFRIQPIDARGMDPQQRLLLETSWRAIEDAGIDPESLSGSRTGVYAGIGAGEYRRVVAASGRDDSFYGTSAGVAVGRVAFTLGLEGPAVPVDLACASSLVAIHQAVTALQHGEVDLAIAGGANAVLSTATARFLDESSMLSKRGRCAPFDAAADGFVRGEGCGIVLLKRLSEAEADGDRIWAVIRGSGVSQSGSGLGLTVPSGPAQMRAMNAALSRAGLAGTEIDYLEAHGAATAIGDVAEMNAAVAVYGQGRDAERPLLMGSVKTNIGHLESAAAVAGLIKTVLAMRAGVIPRHLNFENPTPDIDWEKAPVRVTSEATPWPRGSGTPVAAVNTFAISGANAHVVLEGYGEPPDPIAVPAAHGDPEAAGEMAPRAARLLPLSGRSEAAVQALAGRYLAWLERRADELSTTSSARDPLLSDMAYTASTGRRHFSHRTGVVFGDVASLREQLHALEASGVSATAEAARSVAFLYPAAVSGWPVGEALYRTEPLARSVLDRCDRAFREATGSSLLDAMFGGTAGESDRDDPAWAASATFALECALTALWAGVGIEPAAVAGDGPGAIAAAQAAGVFTLEEGLQLVLAQRTGQSPGVACTAPSVALVSGVTGRMVGDDEALDTLYWQRVAGEPAAPDSSLATLAELGVGVVVEIGPRSLQSAAATDAWPDRAEGAASPTVLASLDPARTDGGGFVAAVGRAYEAGLSVDFPGLFSGEERRRISLPGYPFQRRRYWVQERRIGSTPIA